MNAGVRGDAATKRISRGRWVPASALALVLALTATACADADGSDADPQEASEATTDPESADESTGGTSETPDATADATSVTVGWTADMTTLDAANGQGANDYAVHDNVYEHLTRRSRDGTAEPAIAESWEYNDDATELTLNIRQGVVFHNGDPVTAEDVAWSLNRLADEEFPGQPVASHSTHIDSAEAVDERTVQVTFERADPLYMHNSAGRTPITPASLADEIGEDGSGATPETAVSAGPYKFVEWARDDQIVLAAHEDYWQGAPAIDEVTIRPIPDPSSRAAALLAEEVDMIGNVAIEQIGVVDDSHAEIRQVLSAGRYFGQINAHAAGDTPLANRDVREALAWSVDLQAIIDTILEGNGELVPVHTLPIEAHFNDELEPYGYDPERARQALERAGYPDGIDGLRFLVRTRDPKHAEVGAAMQAMWAEVGINTELEVLEDSDFADAHNAKDVDLSFWVHSGGNTFHANFGLRSPWGCDEGNANWNMLYCNEDVYDILVNTGPEALLSDEAEADRLFKEAQAILHEDYATFGTIGIPWNYGVDEDLNWEPHPDGRMWMYDASW